jgi:hypothetical protein
MATTIISGIVTVASGYGVWRSVELYLEGSEEKKRVENSVYNSDQISTIPEGTTAIVRTNVPFGSKIGHMKVLQERQYVVEKKVPVFMARDSHTINGQTTTNTVTEYEVKKETITDYQKVAEFLPKFEIPNLYAVNPKFAKVSENYRECIWAVSLGHKIKDDLVTNYDIDPSKLTFMSHMSPYKYKYYPLAGHNVFMHGRKTSGTFGYDKFGTDKSAVVDAVYDPKTLGNVWAGALCTGIAVVAGTIFASSLSSLH